jgi:hypothetical protein
MKSTRQGKLMTKNDIDSGEQASTQHAAVTDSD